MSHPVTTERAVVSYHQNVSAALIAKMQKGGAMGIFPVSSTPEGGTSNHDVWHGEPVYQYEGIRGVASGMNGLGTEIAAEYPADKEAQRLMLELKTNFLGLSFNDVNVRRGAQSEALEVCIMGVFAIRIRTDCRVGRLIEAVLPCYEDVVNGTVANLDTAGKNKATYQFQEVNQETSMRWARDILSSMHLKDEEPARWHRVMGEANGKSKRLDSFGHEMNVSLTTAALFSRHDALQQQELQVPIVYFHQGRVHSNPRDFHTSVRSISRPDNIDIVRKIVEACHNRLTTVHGVTVDALLEEILRNADLWEPLNPQSRKRPENNNGGNIPTTTTTTRMEDYVMRTAATWNLIPHRTGPLFERIPHEVYVQGVNKRKHLIAKLSYAERSQSVQFGFGSIDNIQTAAGTLNTNTPGGAIVDLQYNALPRYVAATMDALALKKKSIVGEVITAGQAGYYAEIMLGRSHY